MQEATPKNLEAGQDSVVSRLPSTKPTVPALNHKRKLLVCTMANLQSRKVANSTDNPYAAAEKVFHTS